MEAFGLMLGYYIIKFGITVVIIHYTGDPKHMKEYEKEFLEHYGAKSKFES